MTLTGPQKVPFASQSEYYGTIYQGSAMEVNVGLLHTTEGASLVSYGNGAEAPNITGVPDFVNQNIRWHQHYDVDRSSRALVNQSGGVETNTLNVFQIELVGTCDPVTHTRWLNSGIRHVYWPEAPDWALKEVAVLVRWLSDNHGIPLTCGVTFKAYPASYGAGNGVRLSGSQWSAYKGWLGHQHAPENYHGDPGSIGIDKILAYATGTPQEEDVALTDQDIAKIAQASYDKLADNGILNQVDLDRIWKNDIIPAATPPFENDDYFAADGTTVANPTWTATYSVSTIVRDLRDTVKRIRAIESKLSATATAGVDLDALAVKVANEIYKRMAS